MTRRWPCPSLHHDMHGLGVGAGLLVVAELEEVTSDELMAVVECGMINSGGFF